MDNRKFYFLKKDGHDNKSLHYDNQGCSKKQKNQLNQENQKKNNRKN